MKGRDLRLSAGLFSAELLQRFKTVKSDEVGVFDEKIDGRSAKLIVANRRDGLRIMVLYDDGGVLRLEP
jgi:hypothetical protein